MDSNIDPVVEWPLNDAETTAHALTINGLLSNVHNIVPCLISLSKEIASSATQALAEQDMNAKLVATAHLQRVAALYGTVLKTISLINPSDSEILSMAEGVKARAAAASLSSLFSSEPELSEPDEEPNEEPPKKTATKKRGFH